MAVTLLETDQALTALLNELKTLKSSSTQLQDASRAANEVTQTAEKVTSLSAQVFDRTSEVIDHANQQMDAVKTLADEVEILFKTEVGPKLTQAQKVAAFNRWLLVVGVLLIASNVALTFWLFRVQMMH